LILIVEDDAVMRGVLTVALRGNGYDVKPAPTGRAALEEVELRTPDAVFLDLGLPDMDGFDVIASTRCRSSSSRAASKSSTRSAPWMAAPTTT
jgi:two-component system response regulator AdeR